MRSGKTRVSSSNGAGKYVDARELREWLLRFRDDLPGLHGRVAASSELVMPAFVFSLSTPNPSLAALCDEATRTRARTRAQNPNPNPGPEPGPEPGPGP